MPTQLALQLRESGQGHFTLHRAKAATKAQFGMLEQLLRNIQPVIWLISHLAKKIQPGGDPEGICDA